MSDTGWTWERHKVRETGATEYYGSHEFRSAVVTHPGPGWQATVSGQRSPYFRSPAAAKNWAQRYGRR